jgi:hypothetical protein
MDSEAGIRKMDSKKEAAYEECWDFTINMNTLKCKIQKIIDQISFLKFSIYDIKHNECLYTQVNVLLKDLRIYSTRSHLSLNI